MIKSDLTDEVVLADDSNYTHGRDGCSICKITPHHMAGILSGRRCAEIFQEEDRGASANYCIGNDGDIVLSVPEEYRAWTSCSRSNDCRAITIEVSDCDWDWNISDKAWNSLVNLCVDICRRYGFRLDYDYTPNGSLTRHNMFDNTDCPGEPFQARFPELAETVNRILDGEQPPAPTPGGGDEPVRRYQNGSTQENIYSDSDLTHYIGYLSPWESCDCFGEFNGRAMVRYHVDGTDNNYKIGFAEWTGGIQ